MTSVPNGQEEEDDNSSTRKDLEDKAEQSTKSDNEYTVYEFWGPVPGEHLKNWGITSAKDGIDYEFQVMWSGNYILKVMANPDPLNRRPYHKATFKRTVGSFWGRGVPQLMRGSQDRANAAIRSLITNMGMASGPQAVVDVSRLAKGERVTDLFPRRVWQTTNEFNLNAKPVDFMIIPSNAGELQAVYDRAVKDADTESGVPAYNYGSDQMSGPARTVGGLSILMNAAARGIKEAFSDIDQNAINPLITRFYVWNMLYSEDEAVKGDLNVVAKGASGMLLRELQLQKLTEFMDRTNNPLDQQILGIEGRAGLLRKQAKLLNIDTTDIVPSEDEMERRVAQAQQEQAQQQAMMQRASPQGGPPSQGPGFNLQGTTPRDEAL